MKKVKVKVWWDEMNTKDKEDLIDKKLFEKSISNYIKTFKHLPIKGLSISNGRCDAGEIDTVVFNGISNIVLVELKFA